ncbi:MAG: alpha-L-rhamnosidase [Bacteroidetes bacterium]|nr:MAG: alpha-L-rhamnosidase [Bacteroidota bacterium]
MPSRRRFLQSNLLAGAGLLLPGHTGASAETLPDLDVPAPEALDLTPARWIWYPSGRTLANTFILLRREIDLPTRPTEARGWILGDSRYRLWVNGQRVQWGPAPADPRFAEADPLDLAGYLRAGPNVLGVEVLYYGHGDGTWPTGKPGFLFSLELTLPGGASRRLVSDADWRAHWARSWPAGQYKRWYLRALQEEFDARLYPEGWLEPGYVAGADWLPAQLLTGRADQPAIATDYPDYAGDVSAGAGTRLLPRRIPMLHEEGVDVRGMVDAYALQWQHPPEAYFALLVPDAYQVVRAPVATPAADGWQVSRPAGQAAVLTFDLHEQVVGWPYFEIEAPVGTTVELLTHEAHDASRPALINTHFNAWSRWICREGWNRFEAFDFESLRWLQLHIHPGEGPVRVRGLGVRRRVYPWRQEARVAFQGAPDLQRLIGASLNTLDNCAQETLVDGMGRERQQYSGDVGHQLHALYTLRGEYDLPARYLATYSQGLTREGFFLDTWPAYDRLARLAQRQLELTPWGPLLDHGVGFTFDSWYHYRYSGRTADLTEVFPRLLRFYNYLLALRPPGGLLPVEDLGIPVVWIDNYFERQSDKHCAFNLYVAAMMRTPLPELCQAMGRADLAQRVRRRGDQLLRATQQTYWDGHTFVCNRPQLATGEAPRYDYRSLSMALLHDLCPGGEVAPSLDLLVRMPPAVAPAFLPNEGWRLRALARHGRADVVVRELRERWAPLNTVVQNNTLGEDWDMQPDGRSQWSHAGVAPLYLAVMGLAGIEMLAPGGREVRIRPQLADLPGLRLSCHTPLGPIGFEAVGQTLTLDLPPGLSAELWLPPGLTPRDLTPVDIRPEAQVFRLTGHWSGRFR